MDLLYGFGMLCKVLVTIGEIGKKEKLEIFSHLLDKMGEDAAGQS